MRTSCIRDYTKCQHTLQNHWLVDNTRTYIRKVYDVVHIRVIMAMLESRHLDVSRYLGNRYLGSSGYLGMIPAKGSGVKDPGSPRIMDPRSAILDLGSRILDPGSRILDPGSWIQVPGSRILDPGSWI